MSNSYLNAAWRQTGLTMSEKSLLACLADHANPAGRCNPGVARLAKRTSQSESSIRRSIRSLQEKGLISTIVGGGRGKSTMYQLLLDIEIPNQGDGVSGDPNPVTVNGNPVTVNQNPVTVNGNPVTVTPEPLGTLRNHQEPGRPGARSRRSKRCPDDFLIDDSLRKWLVGEKVDIALAERELSKFRDYEFRTPRSDWPAAFRNWIRQAVDRQATLQLNSRRLNYTDQLRADRARDVGDSLFAIEGERHVER